jgi:hypothetical protein
MGWDDVGSARGRTVQEETVGTVRSTIFRNTQWEVTNFGMSSRMPAAPCRYDIDAERLLATELGEKGLYAWPVHVARMAWVDPDLFFEGFKAAVDAHQRQNVDLRLLEESVEEAVRDRAHHPPARKTFNRATEGKSGKGRSKAMPSQVPRLEPLREISSKRPPVHDQRKPFALDPTPA